MCPADGTVLEKTGDELVGQMLTDKYRIDERISEGGMGTVYRATHVLMEKRVAIKILHPTLAADDKIVARFSREARAASRISHPHALNVTDFGESQSGVVFLVMEYLHGRTLKEEVQAAGPLALPRVVEIIKQVTGALDSAHAEGVVHRDLKSDNIMLVEAPNGSDWAKVLDFGIAKIKEPVDGYDPGLTAPNLIIGTPQYMSPEQCSQASDIDARSDIYSLGIIIYEMLVGHVPFVGDSPTAIMMKHLQEPPPSVLEERKDLPPEVGKVIARALAKRPEERFQSAGELSKALEAAAAGEVQAAALAAASTNPATASSETSRIVVPTEPNEAPRHTLGEEMDESTVIQAKPAAVAAAPASYETQRVQREAVPPPPDKFNPWRIVVPSLAALVVLFGVIYLLTYKGSSAEPSTNQTPALTVDPNSKPVQPAQAPTGTAEQGITSGSVNTNTANAGAPTSSGAPTGDAANANTANENANKANDNSADKGQTNGNENKGGDANENTGTYQPPTENKPARNSNKGAPPDLPEKDRPVIPNKPDQDKKEPPAAPPPGAAPDQNQNQ